MTKRNLALICVAVILTSIVVSGATFAGGVWYMKNNNNLEMSDFFTTLPFTEPKQSAQSSFHSLDKLVFSVKGERQTHFVMLELALKTRQPEKIKDIDNYMPVVRNALLRLFSNKTYEQLQSQPTIDALQEEVRETLVTAFVNTNFSHMIDDVLLTKYVVQ